MLFAFVRKRNEEGGGLISAKPGELKIAWTRDSSRGGPDLAMAWGEGCDRSDKHLLFQMLNGPMEIFDSCSFVDELVARGYDITTLRFSIKKKERA